MLPPSVCGTFVADPFLSCVARSGASGHVQLHGFLGTLGTALGGAGVEEAGAVVGEWSVVQ